LPDFTVRGVMLRCQRVLLTLVIILASPVAAFAQGTSTAPPKSAAQPPSDESLLKPEQLDALVAPIALYPDALLANLLAASTYPLEVVQADRWLKENKNLKGDQLKAAVDKQGWDDSVKALGSTPTVLAMMNDKLDWTQKLGDAVLAQQPDVMDAIQRLRSRAQANDKLKSTREQKVTVQQQAGKQVIVIEPTDPNTMYVPYYEPSVVYGEWPYPDYPPYYFGYPSYIGAGVIAAGLAFGGAWAIARWGNYWGGGCNWGNNNFFINRSNNINNINWQHRPEHRQGVRYNNANVQQRFGNNNLRAGAGDRMDFRGRGGQQVLNPGKDRVAGGDHGGNRVSAGDRGGGDRAANRGGGERAAARDKAGSNRQAKGDRGSGSRGGSKQAHPADRARGGGAAGRDSALRMQSGRAASAQSARGRQSFASMPRGGAGGGVRAVGGGAPGMAGGGGGFRGGGGGGGRRSDIALKHDIVLLGHLKNGLGYYRFSYLGSQTAYVGVIAQEVQQVRPDAVVRGRDGYLRVYYDRLGIEFRTYREWLAHGARIPTGAGMSS
jgi:hypothetical protein